MLVAGVSIIAGAAFVALWPIPGLYCVTKRWVLRQPMPTVEDVPMAMRLNKFFKFRWFHGPEYMIEAFLTSALLWSLLMLMVGMIYAPVLRWVVLPIVGVVFGLYALRWGFDTKAALDKIKETVHEHDSKGE